MNQVIVKYSEILDFIFDAVDIFPNIENKLYGNLIHLAFFKHVYITVSGELDTGVELRKKGQGYTKQTKKLLNNKVALMFPYDVEWIKEACSKHKVSFIDSVLLAYVYYQLDQVSNRYVKAEEIYRKEYYLEMASVRKLLDEVEKSNNKEVNLSFGTESSAKIPNTSSWLTNHLKSFIDDYLINTQVRVSTLENETFKEDTYHEKKQWYFQYCFYLYLNRLDKENKMRNNILRFLIDFMDIIGMTYDQKDNIVANFIKTLSKRIVKTKKDGTDFVPLKTDQYYMKDYDLRLSKLETKSTYTPLNETNIDDYIKELFVTN